MNIKRLKALRDVLVRVQKSKSYSKRFDMTMFAKTKNTKPPVVKSCGTSACAAGWYLLLAKPRGFSFYASNNQPHWFFIKTPNDTICCLGGFAEHFGIEEKDVCQIFSEDSYGDMIPRDITAAHVIARVDELLARGK